MRDYGKIHTKFWISPDTLSLDCQSKLLALYLLAGPHTNMVGCMRVPFAYAAEDLGWDTETVTKGFRKLSEAGFIRYCDQTKWVWIRRFLKFNPLENPKQGDGALRLLEEVPEKASFLQEMLEEIKPYMARASKFEAFRKSKTSAVFNPSERVSEPLLNQEQEQEQEQELFAPSADALEADNPPNDPAAISPSEVESTPSPVVAAQDADSMAIIRIPLNDKTERAITQAEFDEMAELYPAVDVMAELRKIRGWCLGNPARRKTKSGVMKSIHGWLAKEQDKGPKPNALRGHQGAPPVRAERGNSAASEEAKRLFSERQARMTPTDGNTIEGECHAVN
jgi:hypothetical protein